MQEWNQKLVRDDLRPRKEGVPQRLSRNVIAYKAFEKVEKNAWRSRTLTTGRLGHPMRAPCEEIPCL